MLSDVEIEHLAGAANKLRPDWTAKALKTWITANMTTHTYADVAVALAVVSTDPEIRTPAVLLNAGPWWVAAQAAEVARRTKTTTYGAGVGRPGDVPRVGPDPGAARCEKPGHEYESAHACRLCRAESLDAGTSPASERAFAPDDAEAAKPVHAVLRATAREVLCGVPRNGGGVWMQLGSDPALLIRRTTCPDCRAVLERMMTGRERVASGGAIIRDDAGGHYMLEPPGYRPPHPGVFVVVRSGLVNLAAYDEPFDGNRLQAVSTNDTVTMPEPVDPRTVDVR
jgi:hypothetical protein